MLNRKIRGFIFRPYRPARQKRGARGAIVFWFGICLSVEGELSTSAPNRWCLNSNKRLLWSHVRKQSRASRETKAGALPLVCSHRRLVAARPSIGCSVFGVGGAVVFISRGVRSQSPILSAAICCLSWGSLRMMSDTHPETNKEIGDARQDIQPYLCSSVHLKTVLWEQRRFYDPQHSTPAELQCITLTDKRQTG